LNIRRRKKVLPLAQKKSETNLIMGCPFIEYIRGMRLARNDGGEPGG
jgi:hypothetical protein